MKFVKIISKLIGFAISLIIIGVVVKKVGEPILSRQINNPYTEKLTNYALNELVFPPTQQELINWTKKLESEGHIDHSYDVTLHYIQISGDSDGVLYVSY